VQLVCFYLNPIDIILRLLCVTKSLIIPKNKLLNNPENLGKFTIIFFVVYFVFYLVTVGFLDSRTSSFSIIMNIELKIIWTAAVGVDIRVVSGIVCHYWEKSTREPVKIIDFEA
jgi:hypothetical protein